MHVIGPELGLTQPGMTIACGDSHTSHARRVRRDRLRHRHQPGARRARHAVPRAGAPEGAAHRGDRASSAPGVYAKDVILHIIRTLGVKGGVGYAYEYAGPVLEAMTMEERMTVCNMTHRGRRALRLREPRRDHLRLPARPRRSRPQGEAFERARRAGGAAIASDPDARYDDRVELDGARDRSRPSPGASTRARRAASTSRCRAPADAARRRARGPRGGATRYMGLRAGRADRGHAASTSPSSAPAPTAASRDLREAARVARSWARGSGTCRRWSCPARRRWRARPRRRASTRSSAPPASSGARPGCSMCLAMNPDKLVGRPGLRLVQQPQLQGPPGLADRAARC